jgi:hypothetical protein
MDVEEVHYQVHSVPLISKIKRYAGQKEVYIGKSPSPISMVIRHGKTNTLHKYDFFLESSSYSAISLSIKEASSYCCLIPHILCGWPEILDIRKGPKILGFRKAKCSDGCGTP